jgi:sigma-B regulation protein RsbU (phosphoserine phosphatase)
MRCALFSTMADEDDPQGESLYHELYQSAPCGLISTAGTGMITHVNRTLCSWLGVVPEALLGKRRFQDLLAMGSKIFHQTHWLPLLQVQGSVAEVQFEFVHHDGRVVPMLVNAMLRTVGTNTRHDIAVFVASDRRTYERELLAARKRAEHLLEAERAAQQRLSQLHQEREQEAQQRALLAEQLVGIVSHDLRTPLNVITLAASLLTTTDISPAHARTIQRIGSAAQRAKGLIADLLDFTQARLGGGLRVGRQGVDLHQLVAESLEDFRMIWPGRLIEQRRIGDGLVEVDDGRLAQIVTNLGGNAMTYGDPTRPVTFSTEIDASEARLCVHNHGRAIPDDLLPHIFEPLRRGEHEIKLGSRSVGLGLYIVQEIAKAHAGRVSVHSTEADGTTFCVHLPRAGGVERATDE